MQQVNTSFVPGTVTGAGDAETNKITHGLEIPSLVGGEKQKATDFCVTCATLQTS